MQFCKAQLRAVKVKPTDKSIHTSRLIITDLGQFPRSPFRANFRFADHPGAISQLPRLPFTKQLLEFAALG